MVLGCLNKDGISGHNLQVVVESRVTGLKPACYRFQVEAKAYLFKIAVAQLENVFYEYMGQDHRKS